VWYRDADGDGFAALAAITSCTSPGTEYTLNTLPTTDCDDDNAVINPATVWYLDADGDGYADPATVQSCASPGTGYTTTVLPTTDCDDNDGTVNLNALWYLDADGDGYADALPINNCSSPGEGYSTEELPLEPAVEIEMIVYPNPSAGLYRVAMDKEYRQLEVSVATASNQSVFRKIYFETKDIDIDFSALSSGVYFLNITAEGNSLGSFKMVRK
ncbi:MAG: T9SS type A sorting domain-containing protein, partial [Flavobacteriaceae bacterium]